VLPALTQPGSPRPGFTLVELLVVIAIIIVLAGLLLVAAGPALNQPQEAGTRTDIAQLSAAIEAFQTKFHVGYIPSRIILCKFYSSYINPATGQPWTPMHQDSIDYLTRLFPRITTPGAVWGTTGIDWSGDGVMQDPPIAISVFNTATGNGTMVNCFGFELEGEQCLPFFLGGIPQANLDGITFTATGFSSNGSNPAQSGGDRIPPMFEFKSNRLIHWTPPGQPPGWDGTAPGFPSYIDGYGQTPYAYFSSSRTSDGKANGYNRYVNYSNPYLQLWPARTSCGPVTTDCQALPFAKGKPVDTNNLGAWPYAQSMGSAGGPQYMNPRTFQIISAGKDLYFGQGTVICTYPGGPPGSLYWSGLPLWSPASAPAMNAPGELGGGDDIANFHDRLLGVPTQ
jgi:type II secretory pathway pseudopilin PulG